MSEIPWDDLVADYVKFVAGVPKTLVVSKVALLDKPITDKNTGKEKMLHGVQFTVIKEDGIVVEKQWGVTAKKLLAQLRPLVENGTIFNRTIKITQLGSGFDTRYTLELV